MPAAPLRITPGADKGHDTSDFVNELQSMNVMPTRCGKKRHSVP
ncbi:hypothetical protein V1282_003219 [Nitrobacteraceae bacterium AZCC 2146]